jgi:hypothetical protein
MAAKAGRRRPRSEGFTTSTSITIRPNITPPATRMPQASAAAAPARASSRLRRAKASVTAVEETSPPLSPVRAAPRLWPSQRVAT